MKKAILFFPEITSEQNQYPTGLYKIASYCSSEYDIFVLDARIDKNFYDVLSYFLENNDVLCLGVSVMTGQQIKGALEVSKKYHGKVPIVWGGVFPTTLPKQVISHPEIDYIILGDGEKTFLNLLRYLDNKPCENLFANKHNNNYEIHFADINNKEYVNFSKYPVNKQYLISRDGFQNAFTIETSRGCPHRCGFCHNTSINRPYRYIEAENVIAIIDKISKMMHIDGIIFQEDNFFLKKDRVTKIIEFLITNSCIGWKANSRINYFKSLIYDETFMSKIVESRCHVLQFGIESGSENIQKMINKNINIGDVISINREFSKYNIKLRYNFMIGFPCETREDMNLTFKLIDTLQSENNNVEPPFLNIYTPYPGTPLYNLACQKGFVPPESLQGWADLNWNSSVLPWFSREENFFIEKSSREYFDRSKYLRSR